MSSASPQEGVTTSQPGKSAAERARQLLWLGVAIALSLLVMWLVGRYRHEIEALGSAGLLGLFVFNIIGNATVVLPIPIFVASCAASEVYHPAVIGAVAGTGATLGEITGYLAGAGGKALIPQGKLYQRLSHYVEHHGMLTLTLLALIPNPIFDVGGAIAGALRMPIYKFLIAAAIGKSIRLGITAFLCLHGKGWFGF